MFYPNRRFDCLGTVPTLCRSAAFSWVRDFIKWRDYILVQTDVGTHPASCTVGTGYLSRRLKRPGRGDDHPPPIFSELKHVWSYTSTPPPPSVPRMARYMASFTFTLHLNGSRLMICAVFLIQWNWFGKEICVWLERHVWVSRGKTENFWILS